MLDERAALDRDIDYLVAHELAHQWWGDLVTCREWSDRCRDQCRPGVARHGGVKDVGDAPGVGHREVVGHRGPGLAELGFGRGNYSYPISRRKCWICAGNGVYRDRA